MKKGVVLTIVLILILIISIIAGAMIFLLTSQARLLEHQIRRTRAYYAAKASMWWIIDQMIQNPSSYHPNSQYTLNPPQNIGGIPRSNITIFIGRMNAGSAPQGTRVVRVNVNYSL